MSPDPGRTGRSVQPRQSVGSVAAAAGVAVAVAGGSTPWPIHCSRQIVPTSPETAANAPAAGAEAEAPVFDAFRAGSSGASPASPLELAPAFPAFRFAVFALLVAARASNVSHSSCPPKVKCPKTLPQSSHGVSREHDAELAF